MFNFEQYETPYCFPQWLHHFTFPLTVYKGPHPHQHLLLSVFFFLSFTVAILISVSWHSFVVLRFTSDVIIDIEHLLYAADWTICMSLQRNVNLVLCSIFNWLFLLLLLSCSSSLYIVEINPNQLYYLQISSIPWVVFSLCWSCLWCIENSSFDVVQFIFSFVAWIFGVTIYFYWN